MSTTKSRVTSNLRDFHPVDITLFLRAPTQKETTKRSSMHTRYTIKVWRMNRDVLEPKKSAQACDKEKRAATKIRKKWKRRAENVRREKFVRHLSPLKERCKNELLDALQEKHRLQGLFILLP